MNKLWPILLFISLHSFSADNFMEFGNVDFGRDFKEKSKWLLRIGSETIRYASTFPEYTGEHEEIKDGEVNDLNGYGLSFGRDFYLGNGLSSTINLGAYYSKTLDKIVGKAARDIDLDFSETRTAHELTGYEAGIGINYLFDYRIVDIQPFFEIAMGAGQVKAEKQYTRRGFPNNETNGSEEYDVNVTEQFAFSRLSMGVNFISYKGLMSYLKMSTMPIIIASRETKGVTNLKDSAVIVDVDKSEKGLTETKNLILLSIGIGSYF
jgi:hypothetical protein